MSMSSLDMRLEMLPVDQLELDLGNPRIAKWIEMYGDNVDAEGIKLALGAGVPQGEGEARTGPSYLSLKESIRTNGGVIHPIIVNREPSGRLLVIEGNTRAVIYKDFNWDMIPAMIYTDLNEAQIDAIRLQAHLVGTREWDPYSKAKYLHFLREEEHLPFGQLVDFCGGKRREVEELIQAYKDMEEYYRPIFESDQEFDHTRFSAFKELQNMRIWQAIHTAGYSKTDFSHWVNDGKFPQLQQVRQLPRILQNPQSKEVFMRDDAREAIKVLDAIERPTEVSLREASLEMLVREIYNRINSIQWGEIQRLREDENREERDLYYDVRDAVTSFCRDITIEDD